MVAGISDSQNCYRFSTIVDVPIDGAKIKLDWEVPCDPRRPSTRDDLFSRPIDKPIVLMLHGVNNDSRSGYIRSLQRTLTNRGKIAIGMNFRGCGGISLTAPRGYGGAYTGDIRYVVHYLSSILAPGESLVLVGFSIGANLLTKYLGEEGLSGTLPKCVVGGASLGNPLHIHSRNNMHFPFRQLIGQGVKLYLLEHWRVWKDAMSNPEIKTAMMKAFLATTIDQVDEAVAPIIVRNEPFYPFAAKIGYETVEDYWEDASSYRYIKHVSVPLLAIIAGDDQVVYHSFQQKLTYSILNPNVMCVETKCGGHLGWQESPPPSNKAAEDTFLGGPSWASRATADFIDALLQTRQSNFPKQQQQQEQPPANVALSQTEAVRTTSEPALRTIRSEKEKIQKEHKLPVLQSRL